MTEIHTPRLRTVNKTQPLYKLNNFPSEFGLEIGKQVVYILATKSSPTIEGPEWEEIFANSIGAEWKPSNVGLDDVALGNCAWGAKTVKAVSPFNQQKVRLISGRNSPGFSYGETEIYNLPINELGRQILDIWNERVSAIREKFKHLRTVVLIKSDNLEELVVFEFETIRYDAELFYWKWNKNKNLEGFSIKSHEHIFTWQPHGSQFTIIETVPNEKIIISIRKPPKPNKDALLQTIGYDDSWITVKTNI